MAFKSAVVATRFFSLARSLQENIFPYFLLLQKCLSSTAMCQCVSGKGLNLCMAIPAHCSSVGGEMDSGLGRRLAAMSYPQLPIHKMGVVTFFTMLL